jgi:hypothetical protein
LLNLNEGISWVLLVLNFAFLVLMVATLVVRIRGNKKRNAGKKGAREIMMTHQRRLKQMQ